MNTITITSKTDADGSMLAAVTYTEAEVLNFIQKAEELSASYKRLEDAYKDIRNILNEVRDFFSEGEWSDGETTCNKGDVNALLERIGCSKLTSKFRGTFTITGSFNVEVEDEDEIEDIIADNTDVSNYSADIYVEQIEVHDIEEDN